MHFIAAKRHLFRIGENYPRLVQLVLFLAQAAGLRTTVGAKPVSGVSRNAGVSALATAVALFGATRDPLTPALGAFVVSVRGLLALETVAAMARPQKRYENDAGVVYQRVADTYGRVGF